MTLELLYDIERQLLAPGSPFEVREEDVCGETMEVFAHRAPSLRALLERSRDFGERPYVVFGDEVLSYETHFDKVAACAQLLVEQFGVSKGDRVAILGANTPQWVIAFWAATAIGALPVGMNAWWVGDEIAYALDDLQPTVIFADERRLSRLEEPANAPVIRLEKDFDTLTAPYRGRPLPEADIAEDDAAAVLFSSGTTGRPKGIVATHRNIIALVGIQTFHGARVKLYEGALAGREPAGLSAGDSPPPPALVSTPLFHVAGLYAGIITRLATGGTTVWTVGRYDAEKVLALIERWGIGGWGPTPTMVRRLLDHERFDEFDLSTLEFIGMGGSPVSRELLDEVRQRIPSARLAAAVGYGLTEACALIAINFGPGLDAHPQSVGRPLPTVDVEIRDDDGRTLGDGRLGEICVRSPLVMAGYWNNEKANEECLAPGGWLRTGDLGVLRDGWLEMPARRRDLIIRGGENIYPAEIERVLDAHPEIQESAVVAIKDREYGELPHAFVVRRPGGAVTGEELRDYASERLAYFKVPDEFRFLESELPRNASGKILKRHLEHGTAASSEFEAADE